MLGRIVGEVVVMLMVRIWLVVMVMGSVTIVQAILFTHQFRVSPVILLQVVLGVVIDVVLTSPHDVPQAQLVLVQ